MLSRENNSREIIDEIIREGLRLSWKTLAEKKEKDTNTSQAPQTKYKFNMLMNMKHFNNYNDMPSMGRKKSFLIYYQT